jgi:hypothetical protein
MNVVKRGLVIEFVTNLGGGSNGFLTRRNLNGNSKLLASNTKVVGTPQMVFTNPIMTTHVNKILDHYYQSGVQFTNLNHYRTLKVK